MSMTMKAIRLPVPERLQGFEEIERGLHPIQATIEVNRCLLCENAPCSQACPAGIDVRGFIRKMRFQDYRGAVRLVREANIFAGVCGRVCPADTLCEGACRSEALTDPIRIAALHRFLADWEMAVGRRPFALPPATLKPVAVVGAGPAGLAAAAMLRQFGHPVTVLDVRDRAGGALTAAIPPFKLPRPVVDYEVGLVEAMGVEICYNTPFDKQGQLENLLSQGYGAVLLAVGMQQAFTLGLPGEELEGVYTALDVLQAAAGLQTERPVNIGREVVVIGGGSASLNAACCALRMGAEVVNVTAIGTPAEMDAFEKDKQQALEEGIFFTSRMRPVRILGKNGRVAGLEGVRVTWKVPGRFTPDNMEDIPGTRLVMPADTVIMAVGQRVEEKFLRCIEGLKATPGGCLVVDPESGATSQEGIFAAGDILGGRRTVVQSVAEGKRAAQAIHQYLTR